MMGIMVPETCWANNKFCNKKPICCIQLALYVPRINDDARSNSHQVMLWNISWAAQNLCIISNWKCNSVKHSHSRKPNVGWVRKFPALTNPSLHCFFPLSRQLCPIPYTHSLFSIYFSIIFTCFPTFSKPSFCFNTPVFISYYLKLENVMNVFLVVTVIEAEKSTDI